MQFRVGQIIAKCPGCNGTRFKIPADEHSGPRMSYVCADCGKASEYSKLIMQIGRAALQQRRERLSGDKADRVLKEQQV
jgi:hypothetical protein